MAEKCRYSRRGQGGDGSGRNGCYEPEDEIALARVSESLDSDIPKARVATVSFRSEHFSSALVMVVSRSADRKDMNEKGKEYARAETGTYVILHGDRTRGSAEGKVIVSLPEPFRRQGLGYVKESTMKKAKPQERGQGRREMCLDGFYYRLMFCGSKVSDSAILGEVNLTAREVLSHRA